MPSYTTLHVKMQRESHNVPWGFRMQGGRDFGCPLQIQKVNPNSLAERCGMRADDYILRIGQISTEYLQHQEAQEQIKRQNNILEFILQRGTVPTSADYNSCMNFPSHQSIQPMQNNFLPQSQYQSPPHPPSPQIVMPISNNRVMLSPAYNTPIGLYSADNITATIQHTLKSMNIASDYNTVEPKGLNELKATPAKSMPKPFLHDDLQQQQQHSVPPISSSKPTATEKPSLNINANKAPAFGHRIIKRGNKGSASLNQNDNTSQIASCYACGIHIRGPFISAIERCYCVDHFTCSKCSTNLMDCGFVEENGKLYCEHDFEQYFAPFCAKCGQKILKECIHALEKTWHPQCFICTACKKAIGTGSFHVEEGHPYCIEDYQRMFQAKCTGCEFPIEPGDKYLEAIGGIYHAECFNCSLCQVSLDGQAFVVKNNRPYCRQHGRPTFAAFS
ncbi:unnamed protein product [Rotaria sp. Silwood1]|nr:unnamed protein product [Rotaria sp. Silwood1]CAF0967538.1 unnamed protein product [Rotaria sp. Silwood1]